MNTNYNRIKVTDLETNQANKILKTNQLGELEFVDANELQIENYNALDQTSEGKALDARQGKVLKDMIDNLPSSGVSSIIGTCVNNTDPQNPIIQDSSINQAGAVNNTPLQELGGVDKLIHGVRIGIGAGSGTENVVVGQQALENSSTGSYNTSVGYSTLKDNTTGSWNTAIGNWANAANNIGIANTSVGAIALAENTTGSYNTAIGCGALAANKDGRNNVAIGFNAMTKLTGTAGSNVQGMRSIAIGQLAMRNVTTGNGIGIGDTVLGALTTGFWNIAIGNQAGSGITTGGGNTIIAGQGTRSRRYISATIAQICNLCPQSNSVRLSQKK